MLAQEANENKWYESPIDYSMAYEKLLDQVNRKTLGVSLKKLKTNINHQDDLTLAMDEALKARNRFTHHLFREHGLNMLTDQGREKIFLDVRELKAIMQKAYNLAQPITEALVSDHLTNIKEHS